MWAFCAIWSVKSQGTGLRFEFDLLDSYRKGHSHSLAVNGTGICTSHHPSIQFQSLVHVLTQKTNILQHLTVVAVT